MAIAFDAVSTGGSATAKTFSHTCSGSDRLLIVWTAEWRADSTSQVSGVTYNGVALTKLDQKFNTGLIALWYLINPASGAHNIVVTAPSGDLSIVGVSFTGVDQTTALHNEASDIASNLNVSSTVTSATDELVVDGVAHGPSSTITVGAGQTERQNNLTNGNAHCSVSTEPGAASVAMTWTLTTENRHAQIAVSLIPVAAAGGQPTRIRWGGVPFGAGRLGGSAGGWR